MGNAVSAATLALCAAIGALYLVTLLDPQAGTGATATAAAQVPDLLLLASAGGLFTAAAFMFSLLRNTSGAGAGAGSGANNRRLSGLLTSMLCASVGALEFLVFVVQPAGGADPGEQARALGLAALRALLAAVTVTFFLGMLLIVVGHIRVGGEGGGVVVAGDEAILAPVGLIILTKMALGQRQLVSRASWPWPPSTAPRPSSSLNKEVPAQLGEAYAQAMAL
ncbi:hypothetical protein BS78_10G078200 [Paspalum vaginatum]|nr:hypothetical protein BS78_10G078200 [Paspalum vaginatum]